MKESFVLLDEINSRNLWQKNVILKRNEYLKVAGSIDTNVYLIVSGSLRIFVINEFEEHTIRFGYRNNLIASLDSFISEQASNYYIQAIKETELKVIDKHTLIELINSSSALQRNWNSALEQIIIQLLEREQDILVSSPAQRYQRVLKRSPQLFQEIPNKYIASYLRMTPETLSRLKKS